MVTDSLVKRWVLRRNCGDTRASIRWTLLLYFATKTLRPSAGPARGHRVRKCTPSDEQLQTRLLSGGFGGLGKIFGIGEAAELVLVDSPNNMLEIGAYVEAQYSKQRRRS